MGNRYPYAKNVTDNYSQPNDVNIVGQIEDPTVNYEGKIKPKKTIVGVTAGGKVTVDGRYDLQLDKELKKYVDDLGEMEVDNKRMRYNGEENDDKDVPIRKPIKKNADLRRLKAEINKAREALSRVKDKEKKRSIALFLGGLTKAYRILGGKLNGGRS